MCGSFGVSCFKYRIFTLCFKMNVDLILTVFFWDTISCGGKKNNINVYLFLLGIIISNKTHCYTYIHTYIYVHTHTHKCVLHSIIQISCHSKFPIKGKNNIKKSLSSSGQEKLTIQQRNLLQKVFRKWRKLYLAVTGVSQTGHTQSHSEHFWDKSIRRWRGFLSERVSFRYLSPFLTQVGTHQHIPSTLKLFSSQNLTRDTETMKQMINYLACKPDLRDFHLLVSNLLFSWVMDYMFNKHFLVKLKRSPGKPCYKY